MAHHAKLKNRRDVQSQSPTPIGCKAWKTGDDGNTGKWDGDDEKAAHDSVEGVTDHLKLNVAIVDDFCDGLALLRCSNSAGLLIE